MTWLSPVLVYVAVMSVTGGRPGGLLKSKLTTMPSFSNTLVVCQPAGAEPDDGPVSSANGSAAGLLLALGGA